MVFVNQSGREGEDAGHHPDIDIRYNQVKLALVSHDAGRPDRADVKMARTLDALRFARGLAGCERRI